ncbi:MAG: NAD-dependent DNA ligase LigA [Treponemataceae bacterium]|nr:NAD-dependent DNA ligase LigA [Treponemataceae bacterium]
MSENILGDRIKELEFLIKKYQKSYYTGMAEIEDAEFDKLWDELKSLDPDNAILHEIGSDLEEQYSSSSAGGNFLKAEHIIPMGSQEKAADPDAFLAWAKKNPSNEYLVEYKLDGASLELQYENGIFVKGVTRGDGIIGDDITANVLKMKGLVKELRPKEDIPSLFAPEVLPFSGGIRGEVIMSHEVHEKYFSDKANCRNAANGLMKRKDGNGSENLQIICYDALFNDTGDMPYPFTSEIEKMEWLKSMGFETSPLTVCKSAEEVVDYRSEVMEIRKNIPYDIDGLVIKQKKIDLDDARRNRPEKQIAFKFSLEEAVSVVKEVEWSESGATYTPIAIFDPVELAGTTVKRASLVNPKLIRNLNIKIGSHVVVVKRGEIIPKIERVVPHELDQTSTSPIIFPERCSVCGSKLVDEDTRLYCPNKECPKRIHHQLEKWINVIDIRDFGSTLLKTLFDNGRLKSISDIYTLTENELTQVFLNEESLAKEKESLGAKKVLASIKSHRQVSLSTYLAGFDIEGMGETQIEKIVEAGFDSLDKIIAADEEEIARINGFAQISAHAFCQGIKENLEEIKYLTDQGIIKIKERSSGVFSGMSFCFTGELHTMKRQDAELLVKSLGGSAKSSVVKDLTYLVTNDTTSGSSKNKKAQQLGIKIIDENTFLSLAGK